MSPSLTIAASMTTPASEPRFAAEPVREARLWIDGVGCWMVWLPDRISIGGPAQPGSSRPTADLPLFADLSRQHAEIERVGEHYRVKAFEAAQLNGQSLQTDTFLRDNVELTLGSDVRFRFRQPTSLSASATLVCESGHSPQERLDGIVLLDQTCLLGASTDHHIRLPGSTTPAVLFRREGSLWLRMSEEWILNGVPTKGAAPLRDGSVATWGECQFRIEVK